MYNIKKKNFGNNKKSLSIVILVVFYITWLYLSTVFKALLPFAVYQWIGKSIGLLLFVTVYYKQRKILLQNSFTPVVYGIILIIFIRLSCVGTYLSDPNYIAAIYQVVTCVLIFCIFSTVSYNQNLFEKVMITLTVLALINAAIGIWGGVTGESIFSADIVGDGTLGYDPNTGRSGGLQGENYVGLWCAPAFIVGLNNILHKRYFLASTFLLLVSLMGIVASMSRTSAVSIMAACFVVIYLKRNNIRHVKGIVLLFALLLSALFFGGKLVDIQLSRSDSIRELQIERWHKYDKLSGRTLIWNKVLESIIDSPFLGYGPHTSTYVAGNVAHNVYLDISVDYGVIAVIAFLHFPIFIAKRYFMYPIAISQDKFLPLLYGLFFSALVCWLSLSSAFNNIIWVYNGLLYGRLTYVIGNRHLYPSKIKNLKRIGLKS